MAHSYVTRDEFKNRLNIPASGGKPSDAILKLILEAVATKIDDWCYRSFLTKTQTRYYTAGRGNLLVVEDLLSVTSIKTDEDGDRTYEQTWATTDYDLLPFNAATDEKPYTEIALAPDGLLNFPTIAKGVEIVGKWGFFEDSGSVGTLGAEISSATTTTVTMASGHTVEALHTLLIDSEQLYVTDVTSNTLTVVRAVNGTTAPSTHANGTTVNEIIFPDQVREAAVIQAGRLHRRADSPFGVVGSDQYGTTLLRATVDPDVRAMLGPFRRFVVA
jgi:hypothetical protein